MKSKLEECIDWFVCQWCGDRFQNLKNVNGGLFCSLLTTAQEQLMETSVYLPRVAAICHGLRQLPVSDTSPGLEPRSDRVTIVCLKYNAQPQ